MSKTTVDKILKIARLFITKVKSYGAAIKLAILFFFTGAMRQAQLSPVRMPLTM